MSSSATRTSAQASYYPSGYGKSPSLQRARKPFLARNLLTGGAIVGFAGAVYWYSIHAVKQDDFADIQDLLPPASERVGMKTIEEEEAEKKAAQKTSTYNRLSSTASPLSFSSSVGTANTSALQSTAAEGQQTTVASQETGRIATEAVKAPEVIPAATPAAPTTPRNTASAPISTQEQFEMFRLPFFKGRSSTTQSARGASTINGQVDVDRIGSVWDDGVGGNRRLV